MDAIYIPINNSDKYYSDVNNYADGIFKNYVVGEALI